MEDIPFIGCDRGQTN